MISPGKMASAQLPGAMAQWRPEAAAPEPGFQQLAEEMAGLRLELAGLRTTLAELVVALAAAGTPAMAQALATAAPIPGEVRPLGSPSPSALLARRNAERLAGEVQRRTALASDPGDDTELDLLIDRLHELALAKGAEP